MTYGTRNDILLERVPLCVTTSTSPVVAPEGTVVVISELDTTVNSAAVSLNLTPVAPVRSVPRILTSAPTFAPTLPEPGCASTNGPRPTDRLKTVPQMPLRRGYFPILLAPLATSMTNRHWPVVTGLSSDRHLFVVESSSHVVLKVPAKLWSRPFADLVRHKAKGTSRAAPRKSSQGLPSVPRGPGNLPLRVQPVRPVVILVSWSVSTRVSIIHFARRSPQLRANRRVEKAGDKMNRRRFVQNTAMVAAGTAALSGTALSYGRILGANDRISLGHIGPGARGMELVGMVGALKDQFDVEMTAVCDLWSHNLERAVDANKKLYGKAPRACRHPEELIALKDVDAIIISTPEHSHSLLLKMVADAGRDGYCEKPMGNVLEEAKAARDAVQARNLIVQVGTQHRSEPYQVAVRDLIRGGALGDVSKYEIAWKYHGPRWR